MRANELQQKINALVRAAQPKDGSAPIEPVLELGNLVIEQINLIDYALTAYRQDRNG
jgi:hypothetical protein